MKHQILDEIKNEKIHQLLEKNEKILWEGSPVSDSFFSRFLNDTNRITNKEIFIFATLSLAGIIATASCLYFFSWFGRTFLGIVFLFLFMEKFFIYIEKENTHYLISEYQIIFQQQDYFKKKFYSIPFYEIKNLTVSPDPNGIGVIYLAIKNPSKLSFDTVNFENGKTRHQPTLEMIDNVEVVAKIIRQNIKK